MEWSEIAALVFGVTLIMVTGAVVLLRPVLKQLTELGATIALRRPAAYAGELTVIQEELARTGHRVAALETQVHGSDSLLYGGSAAAPAQDVVRHSYPRSKRS